MRGLNGWIPYEAEAESGVGVLTCTIPCRLEGMSQDVRAFLDTGAFWSILPGDIAREMGLTVEGPGLGHKTIHTRLGSFAGFIERATLTVPAAVGEELQVDVTWLIVPEWYGPPVLGWSGCLNRFKFGVDPEAELFHFGPVQ